MKTELIVDQDGNYGYHIFCVGCNCHHAVNQSWEFNGNFEKPTFRPSILCNGNVKLEGTMQRCHSFVTDGMIEYLSDCTHALAGHVVELENVDHDQEGI